MGKQCMCGKGRAFVHCCEPYLKGIARENSAATGTGDNIGASAPTAEALMRSRYTAFVLGDIDYLLVTHHPDYRANDRASLAQTIRTTQWVNLIILATQKGQRKDKTGSVEFVAVYSKRTSAGITETAPSGSPTGELNQLHEKSQFVREGNRWFYTQGDLLPPYQPKRNQPCWCGSGLRFKQCHGSRPS